MLQVGFGLTPFASGSLTFAAAAGALLMKFTAAPILRRFGFRPCWSQRARFRGVPRRLRAVHPGDPALP